MENKFSFGFKLTTSVVFASFILGCAAIDNQSSTSIDNTSIASSSNQASEAGYSSTVAQLGTITQNGIDISVQSSSIGEQVALNTGSNDTKISTQKLSNPDRLVIDIDNSKISKNSAINVADNNLISAIRIGAPNASNPKGRVVIDLKNQALESITQNGEQINVALTNIRQEDASSKAIDQQIIEEISSKSASSNVVDTSVAINKLETLSLDSMPGQGTVAIATFSNPTEFEFKKTAPSEYVATLKGITLSEEAKKTLLSAPKTAGIRSIRPVEKNGDVILRVFAQPENDLTAISKDNTLVIRNINKEIDYLAQPKVELTLPAGEKITDETKPSEASDIKLSKNAKNSEPVQEAGKYGSYSGALISLELQDADIDSALRIIAEVSNLNIIASSDVQGKVTLRLQNVPWDQALDVILKTNGLDKVQEGNVVRIAPVEKLRLEREALKQAQLAEDELEPLNVKYLRVSYARVEDIKPLIKSVLSERGDVAVDARSNQLIVKDIKRGINDASTLVSKLDLRTPQVLLETQIVEASRSFLRDLGSQLGFTFVQSPETGNATGWNFPNSINVGGGIQGSENASNFPASITGSDGGSAIALAFGAADGTKSLDANISALEREGTIKIISRPSVATTNNKPAEITSNETISVLMPNGGINTVVGGPGQNGAVGAGMGGNVATEKIKAGITLKVTPQASPDYFILMDIQAESSNFGSRVVNGIPALFERKATSTVLVSSGQTFAIGGIYRTTDRDTIRGVPFLKDIPVLGNFFSGNTVDVQDEELLFFITPRIIEGSFDDAAMTTEG